MNCPYCEFPIDCNSRKFVAKPKDHEFFYDGPIASGHSYYQCPSCYSIYLYPSPSEEELSLAYPQDYQVYINNKPKSLFDNALNSASRYLLSLRLDNFRKYCDSINSPILDFGCGDGSFVEYLRSKGINAYGYEPSSIEDRSNQIRVNKYLFRDLSSLRSHVAIHGRFQVIIINHLIEHFVNPRELKTILLSLLLPNGVIVGETPNSKHISLNIFRSAAGTLHFPYHVSLASDKSLKYLFREEKLTISPSIMPTGWSMSLENSFKQFFQKHKRGRLSIYILFVLFLLPVSFLEYIMSVFLGTIYTSCFKFTVSPRN